MLRLMRRRMVTLYRTQVGDLSRANSSLSDTRLSRIPGQLSTPRQTLRIQVVCMDAIASGQSNLTKAASPPHMDSSVVFDRWRQCAPPSNTCFRGPTCPYAKQHVDWLSCVCTAQGRESLYCTIRYGPPISPSKLSLYIGGSGPHDLIRGSFGPPQYTTQTASRSVQRFCRARDRNRQTNRQTDHATQSVTTCRIYT